MRWIPLFACTPVLFCLSLAADDEARVLFDFKNAESVQKWQAVNDGVMGGRSEGRFRMTEDKAMEFFGNLSLENNGGFASVRTARSKLNLKKGDVLVARVRGDGRTYTFNLYPQGRRTAFSFRSEFATKKDRWIEVELPVDRFVATSFGRILRNRTIDLKSVDGMGILLGDKKPGPFKLEIDTIKVKSPKS